MITKGETDRNFKILLENAKQNGKADAKTVFEKFKIKRFSGETREKPSGFLFQFNSNK